MTDERLEEIRADSSKIRKRFGGDTWETVRIDELIAEVDRLRVIEARATKSIRQARTKGHQHRPGG